MNITQSALQDFARDILRLGMDANIDGADVQELGLKHGLLKEVTVQEPCGDACACAEVTDFPTNCYRMTEIVTNA